jgi:hypothetical protein
MRTKLAFLNTPDDVVIPLDQSKELGVVDETRVYEAAGTKSTIFPDTIAGTGSDGVDVLVYGSN